MGSWEGVEAAAGGCYGMGEGQGVIACVVGGFSVERVAPSLGRR